MTRRAAATLAWSSFLLSGVLGVGGLTLNLLAAAHANLPETLRIGRYEELSGLSVLAFAAVGALIVSRRPGNWVGWICIGIAVANSLTGATQGYLAFGEYYHHVSLPALVAVAWLRGLVWLPGFQLELVFLPLLFPTGSLPSKRWLPVAVAGAVASLSSILGFALDSSALTEYGFRNPTAGPAWLANVLEATFLILVLVAFPLVIGSLVARFRHGDSVVREQIKWFAAAAALALTVVGGGLLYGATRNDFNVYRMPVFDVLWPLGLTTIPVSIGFAILRYRLYDIDVVINRALLYGSLAAAITAIYLALVVGIGTLLGSGARLNLVLSIAATAVIAVAFQPLRHLLTRLANRLVYGRRAIPYEVLARFSQRTAEAGPPEELPARMAAVLAEGTGANSAAVWLRVGNEMRIAASWPASNDASPVSVEDGELPDLGAGVVQPVRHAGELLGALTVRKARGSELSAIEQRLLADLAAQAALVLRNLRLTAELMQRLDELKSSRERLVTAQDAERRRIERNLHDGAQQQLVALKVKLGLARAISGKDVAATQRLLDELVADADESLQALRDLAHGIYPPLLEAEGLRPALSAQVRKSPLDVSLRVDTRDRFRPDIEAAVYFCCLEALQNAAKYSGAASAIVAIWRDEAKLRFQVVDGGAGYDSAHTRRGAGTQNMVDRLEALGGEFLISSSPGAGTTVSGSIPVEVAAAGADVVSAPLTEISS